MNNFFKVVTTCHFLLLHILGASCIITTANAPYSTGYAPPFLVQIWDGMFLCGGTLIRENIVVTAAHCVNHTDPDYLYVKAGTSKLSGVGIVSKVNTVYIPIDYGKPKSHMDVAVLHLETSLKGNAVQPTGLCTKKISVGDSARVYGWGYTGLTNKYYPEEVKSVTLDVLNIYECAHFYYSVYEKQFTNTMFCATAPDRIPCNGDSGGPVIINDQFCGIISWGVGCTIGSRGVFTNVKSASEFIKYVVEDIDTQKKEQTIQYGR